MKQLKHLPTRSADTERRGRGGERDGLLFRGPATFHPSSAKVAIACAGAPRRASAMNPVGAGGAAGEGEQGRLNRKGAALEDPAPNWKGAALEVPAPTQHTGEGGGEGAGV